MWAGPFGLRLLTGIIVAPACLALALLVYLFGPRNKLNKTFSLSNVSLGLWNAADLVMVSMGHHPYAIYIDRISYFAGIPVIYFFYQVCVEMSESAPSRHLLRGLKLLSSFMAIIMLTPWVLKDVAFDNGQIVEIPGPLYPILIVYFLGYLGYGLFLLYCRYKTSIGINKNQLRYMFVGMFFAFLAGTSYFVSMMIPTIPPVFYVLEAIYLGIFTYAIVRHKLMDINLMFRYATIYFLFALSLALPFSILAMVYRTPLIILFSVFIALFFAPTLEKKVIGMFRHFVDGLPPFRGRYQILSNIPGFQRIISTSASVKHWANNVVDSVNRLIEVSNAVVFIYDERHQIYMATASVGIDYGRMLYSAPRTNDPLILHLREARKLLQRDYVDLEVSPNRRSKIITSLGLISADICVPFFNGEDLIGFLSVGKKIKKGRSTFYEDNIRLKEIQNKLDLPINMSRNLAQVHRILSRALELKEDGDAFKLNAVDMAAGLNAIAHQPHLLESVPDPKGLELRSEALNLLGRYRHEKDIGQESGLSDEEVRVLNVAVLSRLYASELMNMDEEDLFHDEDIKAIWGLVQGAEGALMVILVTLAGQMKTAEWAHDLRHPFTKGSFRMIDAILSGQLGEISKETALALVAVRDDAAFVERQIKTLVDPNMGSALNKKTTSANRLVGAVRERYGYMAKISEIDFHADVPVSDSEIFCDADVILYRVFNNLLDNAIRCTPRGGVVTIGYIPNGHYVKCFVSNVGGDPIPSDVLPHLFERGALVARLDNSGLAGLGLFNVANAIKDHGGEIRVSSSKTEGTTFEFTLPLISTSFGRTE